MKFHCRNDHEWKSKAFRPEPHENFCPSCGVRAEPSLKAKPTSLGKLRETSTAEAQAAARFHQIVTEWPCWARGRRSPHTCRGPVDAHHLVPADWIRQTYGDLPESGLLRILYAPIIGAPACREGFHGPLETRMEVIYFEELDPELIEFCEKVDESYPDRPSMLGRLELESPRKKEAA